MSHTREKGEMLTGGMGDKQLLEPGVDSWGSTYDHIPTDVGAVFICCGYWMADVLIH